MATRYIQQADGQIKPIYSAAQAAVASQVPQTQDLYQTLMGALANQSAQSQSDLVAAAERRGLGGGRFASDVGTALGQALDQQNAQLGAQQASDLANIGVAQGNLGIARANSAQNLGDTLQTGAINAASNKNAANISRGEFNLDMQGATQQDQLRRMSDAKQAREQAAREAAAQARSAAKAQSALPKLRQLKSGGFAFTDKNSQDISALTFAKYADVPFQQLLKEMAMAGDKGAQDALIRGTKSPYWDDLTYSGSYQANRKKIGR